MDVFWICAGAAVILAALGFAMWLTGTGPEDCIRAWRRK